MEPVEKRRIAYIYRETDYVDVFFIDLYEIYEDIQENLLGPRSENGQ